MEPRSLNLVHGANETGKTMIVEAVLSFLFRTGPKGSWRRLRDWSAAGGVTVSGIGGEPLVLTRRSKPKLEDIWLDPEGLPQDLTRLLVVRGGETALAEETPGGIGQPVLEAFLSGERLLQTVASNVPASIRNASLEGGSIQGKRDGEIRKREELAAEIERLRSLLARVDGDDDRGEVLDLARRVRELEAEHAALRAGRRHQAFLLAGGLRDLETRIAALPGSEVLGEAEADARAYVRKEEELERRRGELAELEKTSAHYTWTRTAAEEYDKASHRAGNGRGRLPLTLLAALLLAGAAAAGLLGAVTLLAGLGAAAAVLLVIDFAGSRSASSRVFASTEVDGIRKGYLERFGVPLESLADLRARAEALHDSHAQALLLQKGILEQEAEIASIGARIRAFFHECGAACGSPSAWQGSLTEIRGTRAELERQLHRLQRELDALGVQPPDYLPDPPAAPWDPSSEEKAQQGLQSAREELQRRSGSLRELQVAVITATGADASATWGELHGALSDLLESRIAEHAALTARILAGVCVMQAVREFKGQERTRVEQGLASPEIAGPLRALTGGYDGLSLGEDWEILLASSDGEERSLGMLSTGALEQVHIALRTGFARLALGDTAFLILDDAFQHSDWSRRRRLVAHAVDLVREGWQVFYFTMDDHIRDLFEEAGAPLGADFLSVGLP